MMNISKQQLLATVMLGLLLAPCSAVLAQPMQMGEISSEVVKQLAPDTYIIDWKKADITGDKKADGVYLIGHKGSKTDIYADHLTLVVEDGDTKGQLTVELESLGGYEGKLFLGDFSGDKVADVMISVPTGGSGGMVDHRIVSFVDGQAKVIFTQEDNRGIQFTGEFIDGFQAQVNNEEYGIHTKIDLQNKKELYVKSQIYNIDGQVVKAVKPMSYPLASLEPVDYNKDGLYELKGIQRIIGAYGADGIGNIYSSWKYENKHWVAQNIEITAFFANLQSQSLIARPSAKTVILTELDNNKEITVESGDEIQIKLQGASGTGYQWLLDSFDRDEIELVSEKTEQQLKDKGMPGAPYTKIVTLKTKKIGKFAINLYNFRSWESKEQAVGSFSIVVNNLPKGL